MSKFCRIAFLLAVLSWMTPAVGQRIVAVNIDSTHCVGDSLVVTAGYAPAHNVYLEGAPIALAHPQCTFLSDGPLCTPEGACSHHSPVTFTSFDPGSKVTSAEDIDYVRLNIEHSYIGDLSFALQCPNGQYAVLMPNSRVSSVVCDSITVGQWNQNSNYPSAWGGTHLGEPIDEQVYDNPCDSTDTNNIPGVGWNYCWSESPTHQYAPGDGLIYRSTNTIQVYGRSTIDSTHMANNSQYYRPATSFSSLIDCPLNGTWTIVVHDSWTIDNGYLFDWELAFVNAVYTPPHLASVSLLDDSTAVQRNDSTLVIAPAKKDTVIDYPIRVIISSGDTLDTTFSIHWLEPFVDSVDDTLCHGDTARWTSLAFTSDTTVHIRETTHYGCDSIVDLRYTFMPTYSLHDTLPYCANEPFMYEGVDYGGPCVIVVPHQSQYGCDSTVTVHLVVIDSAFHLQLQLSSDGEEWSTDTSLHGCRPMTVWLRDTTLFEQWRLWTFGDGDTLYEELSAFQNPMPFSHTYDSVGIYPLTLTAESIHGCVDSAVFRKNAVYVYDVPEAEFTWAPTEVVNHDPKTQFVNESQPRDSLTYLWHIPDGLGGTDTSTLRAPYYRWPVGSSDAEVTLDAFWTHQIGDSLTLVCVDSVMHTVVIINEYLQFPNLVTPNGDGVNDRWEVVNLLDCGLYSMNELWIYNHWGVLVYHVRDIQRPDDFWDPEPYPDGTYYFRFMARSKYGLVSHNGVIEVMR